jgi:hypothetical protein
MSFTMPVQVHKLRGDIAIIEGSGGNIAVLTGEDGKLFVDAGILRSGGCCGDRRWEA